MSEQPSIDAIFCAAIEYASVAEQQAYLSRACGDDADLRRRVERLLQAHFRGGSIVDSPAHLLDRTIDQAPLERAGNQIGPYKLLQQIGEGGMGTVFMAEQSHPVQRKVALKVIKPGMDSRQVIARFEAERQALAIMDHVNIARVFDGGTTEQGRPYFVMELVHGVPITKYCDDNHLSPRERLELFVPVCQAIQHAHQKGIIHRDIKPTNVMVTLYDGKPVPKVIDFGVAKATEQKLTERTLFTQYGALVGTLEYMSPEQAEMSALGVDTRSDIYSLGVLLYELLTGSTPLGGKQMKEAAYVEIVRMIKEQEPPKPSTRLSESHEALASISAQRHTDPAKLAKLMRGELDWIVMKTLEKDRNRRYETANAFAADVQRYLADEPVQACPPSAWYRFRKFARRNVVAMLTGAVVGVAVLSAVIMLAVSNVRISLANEEKDKALIEKGNALTTAKTNFEEAQKQERLAKKNAERAEEQSKIAISNEQIAKANELLARRRYHATQINLAMQAWEAGQATRVLALLESLRPKIDEEDLRSFEWYYLWRLCQGGLRQRFPAMNFDDSAALAITPDGSKVASSFGNRVKIWDARTGRETATFSGHIHMVEQIEVTRDGKTLFASDNLTIRAWDLATGNLLSVVTLGRPHILSARFAIDGEGKTAVVDGGSSITVWDVTTGVQTSVLPNSGNNSYNCVELAQDGKTAAARRKDNSVTIWTRQEAGWVESRTIERLGYCTRLSFSPDGLMLAIAGRTAKLYDVATGQARLTLSGHSDATLSVRYAANGKVLVTAGQDQTARVWDVATGRQLVCLAHPVMVYGAVLSAEGTHVATAAGDIRLWDAAAPEEAIVVPDTAGVMCGGFSADGRSLALGYVEGTKFWDLTARKITATLPAKPGPGAGVRSLAFSSDGRWLATANGADNSIEIWTVAGERQAELIGHQKPPRKLALSPDGSLLASASGEPHVILWDAGARQPKTQIRITGEMSAVAFSPDGKTLAVGSQFGTVKLYEATTGRDIATLQRYEFAATHTIALAFSHDNKFVAGSNREGLVQIWDVQTGRLHAALKNHVGAVFSISFAPDRQTLATASADGTVKLWDLATGQERCTLRGHTSPVQVVEFAPDGNTLLTGEDNRTVRLWPAAVDAESRARKKELQADAPGTPTALNEQGDRLWQYERTAEAEDAYSDALTRLKRLAVTFPDSAEHRQETLRSLLSRCLLMEWKGLHMEAEALRKEAREIYQRLLPNDQLMTIWHCHERGRKAGAMNNWRQALLAYYQAVELDPTQVTLRASRAAVCCLLGEWERATSDYSWIVELQIADRLGYQKLIRSPSIWFSMSPSLASSSEQEARFRQYDAEPWYRLALLRLHAGDHQAYRQLCQQLVTKLGPAANEDAQFLIARACTLGPDALIDWTTVIQLAEKAAADSPKPADAVRILGAVLYRAGRFEDAAKRLSESEAAMQQPKYPSAPRYYNSLFQAMTQHRLGQVVIARQVLDRDLPQIDQALNSAEYLNGAAWQQRLTLQLLRSEADDLINKK